MKNEELIIDSFMEKLLSRFQASTIQIILIAFCNEYEEYVKRNRAKKTYVGVKYICNKLQNYFSPERKVESIKVKDAESFLNQLRKRAPKGIYNYHRTLRAMFNKGIEWNYLRENVFAKIKLPKRQLTKPSTLDESVFWEVINFIKIEAVKGIIITAYYTGCRLGELVELTWKDVNLRDKILIIGNNKFQTKSRKQREVPIHPKVEEILIKRFPKIIRKERNYVFCKKNGFKYTGDFISKKFKKACREAGIDEEIHFHSLRHSAATRMILNGAPVPSVQQVLGHSNIQTTMIYTHPNLESLRDAVNRL